MAKFTFNSNVREIAKNIETTKDKTLPAIKIDAFKQYAKLGYGKVSDKYIIKGNFARPSKSGKTLQYTSPPGANISRKRTLFNKVTKFKKRIEEFLWVKGKVVSRSGKYEKEINDLANYNYTQGNNKVGNTRVKITPDRFEMWADDKSELYKLESYKQAGKAKVMPITKAFRSIVNIWKQVKIKLGK